MYSFLDLTNDQSNEVQEAKAKVLILNLDLYGSMLMNYHFVLFQNYFSNFDTCEISAQYTFDKRTYHQQTVTLFV